MSQRIVKALLVLFLGGSVAVPAMELEFVNVFDVLESEERADFLIMDIPHWLAVQEAASSWERAFSDPITVRIAIRHRRSDRVLAQTDPALTTHALADVKAALIADALFVGERSVYEQIPVPLPVNGEPPTFSGLVTMPTANAKALGLSIGRDPAFTSRLVPEGYDALITIDVPVEPNDFPPTYDVTRADGISPGRTDYTGVVEHEIGHALGFLSMVDRAQLQRDLGEEVTQNPRPMDFWRFAAPRFAHGLSETREVLQAPAEFFNGGEAPFVEFSRGDTGFSSGEDEECPEGCPAGHWRITETDGDAPLLMVPSVLPGQLLTRRGADTVALDFVGYDTNLATLTERIRRLRPPLVIRRLPVHMRRFEFLDPDCDGCVDERSTAQRPGRTTWPDPRALPSKLDGADHHVLTELHADGEGLRLRSLAGQARFESATRNERVLQYDLKDRRRRIAKTREPKRGIPFDRQPLTFASMSTIPARLMGLELFSDQVNGPRLVLRAQMPRHGIHFDPSLGPWGGFAITFFVDSSGDGETGDVDAIVNAHLLVAAPFDVQSTLAGTAWHVEGNPLHDGLRVVDPRAFRAASATADATAPGEDEGR